MLSVRSSVIAGRTGLGWRRTGGSCCKRHESATEAPFHRRASERAPCTHNRPATKPVVEMDADEKAGHAVDPFRETQAAMAVGAVASADNATAFRLAFCFVLGLLLFLLLSPCSCWCCIRPSVLPSLDWDSPCSAMATSREMAGASGDICCSTVAMRPSLPYRRIIGHVANRDPAGEAKRHRGAGLLRHATHGGRGRGPGGDEVSVLLCSTAD